MLKNKNIICISSIDWDFIWQGHQEIMSTLARNGNRILFIENTGVRMPGIRDFSRIRSRIRNWFLGFKGIRQEKENLYIFSPLILPFPYLRIAGWINRYIVASVMRKWIKIMDFNDSIMWVFLPTPLSLSIINNMSSKAVIYYCIDNFKVSSVSANKIRNYEIKLLKIADLTFVTSKGLYDYCSKYNDSTHIFPFAVNFRKFESVAQGVYAIPDELKDIKKPIIGYVGGVHKWIDQCLIKLLAQRHPDYSFVFIGPIQTEISMLSELRNVHFLGKKSHERIPYLINAFNVCIIPYLVTEYTANVYPTKLNEYLAMGKPVVSTGLPEVMYFNKNNDNLILIGKTHEEFASYTMEALGEQGEALIAQRISAARKNTWDVRIEEMSCLIEGVLERKSARNPNWRKNLAKFYGVARIRIPRMVVLFLSVYFLVFYTPSAWFLADYLKISEMPVKADVIAVFAGGVGESGRAGQGYEERVQHAVELYKKGYAEHLLLFSGYTYIFKESTVMRALAIELGVPQEAISSEDKAKNTYENILALQKISDRHKWKSILLISSPYHMRRVSLAVNKNIHGLKIRYTPIVNSFFYARPSKNDHVQILKKQITLQQIKGLLREYFGILYYWWRGWI